MQTLLRKSTKKRNAAIRKKKSQIYFDFKPNHNSGVWLSWDFGVEFTCMGSPTYVVFTVADFGLMYAQVTRKLHPSFKMGCCPWQIQNKLVTVGA